MSFGRPHRSTTGWANTSEKVNCPAGSSNRPTHRDGLERMRLLGACRS